MSGELPQEDNPFFEKQWGFVTAVAGLVNPSGGSKTSHIESPLLQGIQHALDKHQIPETKEQANVDGAIEDIAALLFDGIYSCAFIHAPVLLSSGYIIDKAVFDKLSAEGLLSDTILTLHPAHAITQQLFQLFNRFLEAVKERLSSGQVPASLSAWLAEHFSDEINQTHLAVVKQLEQESAILGGKKKTRSRASSVVLGEEAVLDFRIAKIEVAKKRNVEKGTLNLVKSLTQEMEALTEDLKKSSAEKPIESVSQESLTDKTISADHPDRLYHLMGWMMLFFLLAAVVILVVSTFLPHFYQVCMLFLSSHTAVAALLLAALVVFGICVLFTAVQSFLKYRETSLTSSEVGPIQKKDQEEIISQQFTLQHSEVRVLGPFSQSVLDLLDTRQSNIKKYTRLMAVIRSRSSALEQNQRRDEFLQQTIVRLKQEHTVRHDEEKEEVAARKQRYKAKNESSMTEGQEAAKCLDSLYRNLELQLESEACDEKSKQRVNIYKDPLFQSWDKDRDKENKAIYDIFWARYWGDEGYLSDGSVAGLDAQKIAKPAASEGSVFGEYKDGWTGVTLSDNENEEAEEELEEEQDDQALKLLL